MYNGETVKSRVGIASLIWGITLLASRLLALVRDAVLGHTLGVSPAADAYRTAFGVPDWFTGLLAGGALSVTFIPIFSAHLERGDEARGWRTFSNMANLLVLIMVALASVFWVLAPQLAAIQAPGFDAEQLALLTHLTRIILPGQIFHILGGLLSASLLARDRHVAPALAPLVYSVSVILGGWIGSSAEGFAWGVTLGAFAGPFLLPLLVALHGGMKWSLTLDLADPDLRLYLSRWIPVLLGGGLLLLDDTLLNRLGSELSDGVVATLGYAKALMRAPMGIFGAAVGFASFPMLTRLALEGKKQELYRVNTVATRRVLVLAFLSQVGLTVAAPEVGTLVYGATRIAPDQMVLLGTCLAIFAAALGPWSAQILFSRAFYAQGLGWIPARLGLGTIVLCSPLYWFLAHRFGAPGLAAASSITVTLSVVALQFALRRQTGGEGGYGDLLVRLIGVTALAIAAGWGVRLLLPEPTWTRPDAFLRLLALGGVGGVVFVALGWWSGIAELREVAALLGRRLGRGAAPRG